MVTAPIILKRFLVAADLGLTRVSISRKQTYAGCRNSPNLDHRRRSFEQLYLPRNRHQHRPKPDDGRTSGPVLPAGALDDLSLGLRRQTTACEARKRCKSPPP